MFYIFGPPAVAGRVLEGLSVLLSRSFRRIGSLVCSETKHGFRGPCGVVCDRARILEKNIFAPKMGKISQKWAKNRVY